MDNFKPGVNRYPFNRKKYRTLGEAARAFDAENVSIDAEVDRARQEREDAAALAFRAHRDLMEEHSQMLARLEDARAVLAEDLPRRSSLLEAEVAAAEARTNSLVRMLPGTPEEIRDRLEARGAVLEGAAHASSSHDAAQ